MYNLKLSPLLDLLNESNLQDEISLTETFQSGDVVYSLYLKGRVINAFKISSDNQLIDEIKVYEYCLGFIECYMMLK